MLKLSTCLLILTASAAYADLIMRFDEGAPKDRFTLTNTSACALGPVKVTLDLGTAPAGLIFDVTSSGAGVEVFQPFELIAGAAALTDLPQVLDGDTAIQLNLKGLGAGQSVAFTSAVDDTGGGREITVSGSEIENATLQATFKSQTLTSQFSDKAMAQIPYQHCTS